MRTQYAGTLDTDGSIAEGGALRGTGDNPDVLWPDALRPGVFHHGNQLTENREPSARATAR